EAVGQFPLLRHAGQVHTVAEIIAFLHLLHEFIQVLWSISGHPVGRDQGSKPIVGDPPGHGVRIFSFPVFGQREFEVSELRSFAPMSGGTSGPKCADLTMSSISLRAAASSAGAPRKRTVTPSTLRATPRPTTGAPALQSPTTKTPPSNLPMPVVLAQT